jgi:hypothetical protein
MRNVVLWLGVFWILGCLVACKPSPSGASTTSTDAGASGSSSNATHQAGSIQEFVTNEKALLTPELYEQFLLALKSCKIIGNDIDRKCPDFRNLQKARKRRNTAKSNVSLYSKVGAKHIRNESPAVRLEAARILHSFSGANEQTQQLILEAASTEQEAVVLAAEINVIGSRVKLNPEVKKLFVKMADHSAPVVRKEAMGWFLTSYSKGESDTYGKVLEHIEKDEDLGVRSFLCSRLFGSSDERAFQVFEKLLFSPKTSKDLYAGCLSGLINSWTGVVKPTYPAKAGYELTLKVLKKRPRSEDRPAWSAIGLLRYAKVSYPESDTYSRSWYEKVKAWYNPKPLLKHLEDIVLDNKANWMARTASLDAMKEIGAPKSTFVAMLSTIEKGKKDAKTKHVQQRLQTILEKTVP